MVVVCKVFVFDIVVLVDLIFYFNFGSDGFVLIEKCNVVVGVCFGG